MIRTRIYLIGGAVAVVVLLGVYIARSMPPVGTVDRPSPAKTAGDGRAPDAFLEKDVGGSRPTAAAIPPTSVLPDLTKTPLQSLLDTALSPSTKADDRALAVHLSTTCITLVS